MAGQLYPPVTQHDLGRAAAMLEWAANVIEAANKALEPNRRIAK